MMKNLMLWIAFGLVAALTIGCSGSEKAETPQPALQANEELSLQHFLEGSILDQKGDFAKAILEYQDALHFKQDPAIYNVIAKDYSALGKHDLAMQMGREAVRLAPDNRVYHETLAEIYINAFEVDGATKEYQEIVRIAPSSPDGWMNLARLWQVQNPVKALEVYQEILDRFGPNADTYLQMAQIYNSMNKLDKAA